MITAVHTLVYADDAEAARAFFRDVLGWPHVDSGGGWLIFRAGPAELGVHPTSDGASWTTSQHHELSLMCDDLDGTMAELREKGVTFTQEPRDEGYGLVTYLEVPGAGPMQLYQPRHPTAFDL
jgi:predicted enzyme related to lactoylglutathione lyase